MEDFKKEYEKKYKNPIYIRNCYISILINKINDNERLLNTIEEIVDINIKNTSFKNKHIDIINEEKNKILDENLINEINDIVKTKCINKNEVKDLTDKINNLNINSNLKNKLTFNTNINYGLENEKIILEKFLNDNNLIKDERKVFHKHIYDFNEFNVILVGTPDGITKDNKVIEIKSRINDFNKKLKEIDKIQVQGYLNLTNYDMGYLVEGHINKNINIEQYLENIEYSDEDDNYFEQINNNNNNNNNNYLNLVNNKNINIKINYYVIRKDKSFFNKIKNNLRKKLYIIALFILDDKYNIYEKYKNLSNELKLDFIYLLENYLN